MEFVIVEEELERLEAEERRAAQHEKNLKLRQLRDASDPFSETESSFRDTYRLSKELARALIEELRPFLHEGQRSTAVPVELRVLCALNFFGHGSYQKGVGSGIAISMSQPSVSRAIDEVTTALNVNQILTRYIHFPATVDERRALQTKNYRYCEMPGVLGFVDGTYIAIAKPSEHEELYVNEKGFHSLNVQVVCDSENNILNVLSRYCGRSDDSFVWANSTVRRVLETLWKTGQQCWLLGDSSYPLEPWLHVPFLDAVAGSPEENYSKIHKQARSAVERCIGLLKNRFRCLRGDRVLYYDPQKAGMIVNACTVLHNICVRGRLPDEDFGNLEEGLAETAGDLPIPAKTEAPVPRRDALTREALKVRARVVPRLSQYRH